MAAVVGVALRVIRVPAARQAEAPAVVQRQAGRERHEPCSLVDVGAPSLSELRPVFETVADDADASPRRAVGTAGGASGVDAERIFQAGGVAAAQGVSTGILPVDESVGGQNAEPLAGGAGTVAEGEMDGVRAGRRRFGRGGSHRSDVRAGRCSPRRRVGMTPRARRACGEQHQTGAEGVVSFHE